MPKISNPTDMSTGNDTKTPTMNNVSSDHTTMVPKNNVNFFIRYLYHTLKKTQ